MEKPGHCLQNKGKKTLKDGDQLGTLGPKGQLVVSSLHFNFALYPKLEAKEACNPETPIWCNPEIFRQKLVLSSQNQESSRLKRQKAQGPTTLLSNTTHPPHSCKGRVEGRGLVPNL